MTSIPARNSVRMTLCRDVSRGNKPDSGDSVCVLFLSFINSVGWQHELETYWNWHHNSYTQELLPCSILSCRKMNTNLALPLRDGWSFTGTCTLLTWRARWFLSQNNLEKAPLATACKRAGTFKKHLADFWTNHLSIINYPGVTSTHQITVQNR